MKDLISIGIKTSQFRNREVSNKNMYCVDLWQILSRYPVVPVTVGNDFHFFIQHKVMFSKQDVGCWHCPLQCSTVQRYCRFPKLLTKDFINYLGVTDFKWQMYGMLSILMNCFVFQLMMDQRSWRGFASAYIRHYFKLMIMI